MKEPFESQAATVTFSSGSDSVLADLAEELTRQLQSGNAVDLESLIIQYPDHVDKLRMLLPALRQLAELGKSSLPDVEGVAALTLKNLPPDGCVGTYRVVRELGRGGMGVVFEAVETTLGRKVALKVLPTLAGEGDRLRRFEREARSVARLRHDHIVPIFGLGQDKGVHFYVMQLIDGRPLSELLGPLRSLLGSGNASLSALAESDGATTLAWSLCQETEPATEILDEDPSGTGFRASERLVGDSPRERRRAYVRNVARLGIKAAEALEHAAERGVLHRDIKPSNLMLDAQMHVWVTDFGLAKASDDGDLTRTNDLLGTVRYMAPERFRGRIDHRSDIYSLGLTLYELLALRPAYEEIDHAVLARLVCETEPRHLDLLNTSIPHDLVRVIHKAIAREPSDRYSRAGLLAADLTRFLEGRPVLARPVGPLGMLMRWGRRNPSIAILMCVVIGLLLAGSLASTYTALRLDQLARAERAARRDADRRAEHAQWIADFFIKDMLQAAGPNRKQGRQVTVDDVLTQAEGAIPGRFAGEPLTEAAIRDTIGMTFLELGQPSRALEHLAITTALRRQLLGPDHPDTLTALIHQAGALRALDRWQEARDLIERSREGRARVLGPDHPDTIDAIASQSVLARDRGAWAEARHLSERVHQLYQARYGNDDLRTLSSQSQLAAVIRLSPGMGREVRPMIERILSDCRRILGPDHPQTIDALDNLAHHYRDYGPLSEAANLYTQVFAARKRVQGPVHAETLMAQANVAYVQAAWGDPQTAVDSYRLVHNLSPEMFDAWYHLSLLTLRLGDRAGYRRLCQEGIRRFGQTEDPVHAEWIAKLCSLVPDAGVDPARIVDLAGRAVRSNPEKPWFLLSLGVAEYRMGRLEEALITLTDCRARADRASGKAQANLLLACVCTKLGRTEMAIRYRDEATKLLAGDLDTVGPDADRPGGDWRTRIITSLWLEESGSLISAKPQPRDDVVPAR